VVTTSGDTLTIEAEKVKEKTTVTLNVKAVDDIGQEDSGSVQVTIYPKGEETPSSTTDLLESPVVWSLVVLVIVLGITAALLGARGQGGPAGGMEEEEETSRSKDDEDDYRKVDDGKEGNTTDTLEDERVEDGIEEETKDDEAGDTHEEDGDDLESVLKELDD